ncbi:MAG: dTMP kinase [Acidimicrobiales bacterium]|jgi:dTMP kinase
MSGSAAPDYGRLIVLEGIDGCGKSTQAGLLASWTGALLTAEPGATSVGADLRSLLLDPGRDPLSLRTEALLMAADRAEHVDQLLRPTLEAGRWIICDRFNASTLAYQGFGRGLSLDELRSIVAFASAGIEPDLQILLDLPVATARQRMKASSLDRLEHLGDEFFSRVRDGYLSLAHADPDHWAIIDATADLGAVEEFVRKEVASRLGPVPSEILK